MTQINASPMSSTKPSRWGSRPSYGTGREALIRAAITLVARDGLTKLTYRSLAAEASVSHGAIHHHFASIDDVVVAALHQCLEQTVAGLELSTSIDDFFEPVLTVLTSQPEEQAFQADVLLGARRMPGLGIAVAEHQAQYRQYTIENLHALGIAGDPDLVDLLMAVADGIIYQRVAFPDDGSDLMRRQVATLRRLLTAYGAGVKQ